MTLPIINPETGEISQAQVFVAVLPASSYIYAEIQPSQELRHWLSGHVRGFEFFGGVPKILRPDNLKSGVKTPNRYEPELNPSYQELAEHYQIAVLPARVRRSKDKQHLGKSRKELYEDLDRPALRPLPERPYEFAIWKNAKVNIDYHIAFEGHFYSVPHTLIRQEVRFRASEIMVRVFHHGTQVSIHARSRTQGRFSTRAEHMPANHRFVSHADANWFQQEADKIGTQTAASFT